MNEDTKSFLDNEEFDKLYNQLSKKYKPRKPEIDKEMLEGIGLLIVKFQRLEETVRHLIMLLANIANDQTLADVILSKYSFNNLLLVLEGMAIQKDFYDIDNLKFLLKMARKAEEKRNQLVHSVWFSAGRFKKQLKSGKGTSCVFENYSDDDLLKIADMVDKIDTAIGAMHFGHISFCRKQGITLNGVDLLGNG